jgi:hypothetical protein
MENWRQAKQRRKGRRGSGLQNPPADTDWTGNTLKGVGSAGSKQDPDGIKDN